MGKIWYLEHLDLVQKGHCIGQGKTILNLKFVFFFTEGNAIKNGAIHIPVGNGVTQNRTKAWACEECKYVLIDCN